MNLTNRWDLPDAYVRAIRDHQRIAEPRTISVTELLRPPQARALEVLHADELEADVADFLPQFFGTAVHQWLEQHHGRTFAEQRLRVQIDGWTVHGTPDALEWFGVDSGTLIDWKTTTIRALGYEHREWEEQTNLYAHLALLAGLPPVSNIIVWAYLRDWDAGAMARDDGYPRAGIIRRDIPLWHVRTANDFLMKRLALHRAAQEDGDVPECTDDERWKRTQYALVKAGNERATRVFDDELTAYAFAKASLDPIQDVADFYDIEARTGPPLRCQRYCAAAPWCIQWKREQDAMTLPELVAE